MKTETAIEAIKEAAASLGIKIRTERGSFRGGRCIVDGDDVIVLNKLHVPELQLTVLAESLSSHEMENVFLKPAARRALEDAWRRVLPAEQSEAGDE